MSEKMCRVCHETENVNLKSPCSCTGSIKYICVDCANKSIESAGYYCTICKDPFQFTLVNKNIIPLYVFSWILKLNAYITYLSVLLIFSPPIFYYGNYILFTPWSFGTLTTYYLSELIVNIGVNTAEYNVPLQVYLLVQSALFLWHLLFITGFSVPMVVFGFIIVCQLLKNGLIYFSRFYKNRYIVIEYIDQDE